MALSIVDQLVLDNMTFGDNSPVSLHSNALAIRLYGKDDALPVILAKRAETRAWWARTADKWAHKNSRRSIRNAHYDSWSTRESYMRHDYTNRDYGTFLKTDSTFEELGRWHAEPGRRSARRSRVAA